MRNFILYKIRKIMIIIIHKLFIRKVNCVIMIEYQFIKCIYSRNYLSIQVTEIQI